MATDRYPPIKYYAERAKGNVFLPASVSKARFIELIWPTLATSPAIESPDNIKVSVAVEIGESRTLYALGASLGVVWKAIFQEPDKELETDSKFCVEFATDMAEQTTLSDTINFIAKRRGRAQIYFYDKYKKNYYGAYVLVNYRILPLGPITLYVDPTNGSPQSVTLTCYGYPGDFEKWNVTDHRICVPTPSYTTTDITGFGEVLGKNSTITFAAKYKGSFILSYKDTTDRSAKNTVTIEVADGEDPPALIPPY